MNVDQYEHIALLKSLQSEQRRQDGRIKEHLLSHICSYQSDAEKNLLQETASRNPGGELDLLDTVGLTAFLSTGTLIQSVRQCSHRTVSKYAVIPADLYGYVNSSLLPVYSA